jgi:hypothetical protein
MADDYDHALAETAERMGITRRDIESLRADVQAEHRDGHREQAAIARNNQTARHIDGLGEKRLSVSPQLYMDAQRMHGRECWKDPDFVKKVQRDHPETRVDSRSGKTMVGYGS